MPGFTPKTHRIPVRTRSVGRSVGRSLFVRANDNGFLANGSGSRKRDVGNKIFVFFFFLQLVKFHFDTPGPREQLNVFVRHKKNYALSSFHHRRRVT